MRDRALTRLRLPMARMRERALTRLRLPAPTIRLRLTLVYGVAFLITGGVLLTIGYFLVRHNLDRRPDLRAVFGRLGRHPPPRFPLRPIRPSSSELHVAAAVRADLRNAALHQLLIEYVGTLVALTGVSVAAGWWMAGRALRPLRDITATARRVSGENLGERIALKGPADELKELADTFDGMLGRLDRAFASQRRFVANASHELRTPLAIMRTEIDVALADPAADTGELRAMGEAVRETVDRCEALIEGLLTLARSQAGGPHPETVALHEIAADCITDLRARARDAGVQVSPELAPASVSGDPALLERMVANLVDNGIRHNAAGGQLRVATGRRGGRAYVNVRNGGSVIGEEELAGLTEPFRRLGRHGDGFGLGLSIVRSVVEAHGGQLALGAPADGGLEVTVELPSAETTSAGHDRAEPERVVATG